MVPLVLQLPENGWGSPLLDYMVRLTNRYGFARRSVYSFILNSSRLTNSLQSFMRYSGLLPMLKEQF
jgi:hypothetical protein